MIRQLKEKEKQASSNRENSKNASGKKFKSAHSSRSTNEFDEDQVQNVIDKYIGKSILINQQRRNTNSNKLSSSIRNIINMPKFSIKNSTDVPEMKLFKMDLKKAENKNANNISS